VLNQQTPPASTATPPISRERLASFVAVDSSLVTISGPSVVA